MIYFLVASSLGTPILLSSYSINNQRLDISCTVQNIAYTKLVSVKYCSVQNDCSRSFPCNYDSPLNSTFETWKCANQNFVNGLSSFSLSYTVSGKTFEDLGPAGSGYPASIPPPSTTQTTTTSKVPVTSTTSTSTTPAPSILPGCQNYNGLDSCSGDQTEFDPSANSRNWQTPPRGDPRYTSSFQDYSNLQGYADVVYSKDRQSATLTVKAFSKDPKAVVNCKFGTADFGGLSYYATATNDKGALSITCKIINTSYTLILDDFYFYWDKPVISRPETLSGQKGAIVELFGWPYDDIASECTFLSKAGYMGLRIYAPNEHVMSDEWYEVDGNFNPWYFVYQPVSYRLNSRQGTLAQLRNMIVTCRNLGVRVYADAVLNHMTGNGNAVNPKRNAEGSNCNVFGPHNSTMASPYYTFGYTFKYDEVTKQRPAMEYPAVPYGPTDFHCERSLSSYTSGFVLQYGWLNGLADLNTGKDYVRDRIATFLATMVSVGISGFRIDAAKHISPDDLGAIFAKVSAKLGGSLPEEFIAYLEVLLGGEKDLLCCSPGNYNYYTYLTQVLQNQGLSAQDITKIKIWSSDYPKEMPVCGSWIIPPERFVIQNDDHDQQNSGSTSRDMQDKGTVLIVSKDIAAHRRFEVQLFSRRDANWLIRQVLSGYYFQVGSSASGWPDGKSDCANYTGSQGRTCKGVPYKKAYVADACGYSMVENGVWVVGAYTRTHRDVSVINAMRGEFIVLIVDWMGLPATNQQALGIPSSCP